MSANSAWPIVVPGIASTTQIQIALGKIYDHKFVPAEITLRILNSILRSGWEVRFRVWKSTLEGGRMGSESRRKRRRSIRLEGYDYSRLGAYFVTICTQRGECLFGQVIDGRMQLNDAGRKVQSVWDELPDHYPGVGIDAFVVMPNHVHGIVVLTGRPMMDDPVGATPCGCPNGGLTSDDQDGQARGPAPTAQMRRNARTGQMSLPDVVHRFKSFTTAKYRHGVQSAGWPPFPGSVWQRNCWERVIRDEHALRRIQEYIVNNPARWAEDRMHPEAPSNPFVGRTRG